VKRYAVIIEKANGNYSAYLPDVPGCVATGKTIEEVKINITEALKLHLKHLAEDGQAAPEPASQVDYITA
jgi:predicted RNase H-like HicB family nuclease